MATVTGANAYDARGSGQRLVFVPHRPGNIYPPPGEPWFWGAHPAQSHEGDEE